MSGKLPIFPAEQLLQYSYQELKEVLTGEFYLEFPDGILLTNDRETILTMPLWDWLRKRPIPLKMSYHLSFGMQKKIYGKNTHMQLLNAIHWDIYDHYKQNGRFLDQPLLEQLVAEFYEYGNQQYNLVSIWMEPKVVSVNIGDVIRLFEIPEIEELLANMVPTEKSVLHTTSSIKKILSTSKDPMVANNMTVRMARAGIVKMDQLVQALAPTGYIEGPDGNIFPNPLMSNYTDGHRSLHDNMVESCKASQAIEATKAELEDAVYQSRRQELLNQIVMTVHPGDCGSKHFEVTKMREDNGLTDTDLALHAGKLYFLPEEGPYQLRKIQSTDTHLIGRLINMRTITHCAHIDNNGVCETCLGGYAETIPRRTNLGQIMTTDLFAFIIQLQLSKKHYMANSIVQHMRVEGTDAKYLKIGSDGVSYYFNDNMVNTQMTLIIGNKDGRSLIDLAYLADMSRIAINRLTEFTSISLEMNNGDYSERRAFMVGSMKRKASFTHEMLEYIKSVGYSIDNEEGNYHIDMSQWNNTRPFALVPMKNDSLIDFSISFKEHIESDVKKESVRDMDTDIDIFTEQTFEILNKSLRINHAQVELAVYGIMIRSALYGDYALPKPWSNAGIGVMSRAMAMRSLGSQQAFEKHTIVYSSPESFINTNRPDGPLDPILMPGELYHDVDGSGQIYHRDDLPERLKGVVF